MNPFSDCKELLRNTVIRYVILVILLLTLVGNTVVLVSRYFISDKSTAQKYFIFNLGISDFTMGLYLAIVAAKDQMWRGRYFVHDHAWRASVACRAAGVLSMLSSQASLFTLMAITYDRFCMFVNVTKLHRMSKRRVLAILAAIWLASLAFSISPAVVGFYFNDQASGTGFYGTNTVCLPLQLPHEKAPGWQYCLALFGVLNFIMSIYMAVAYAWMFISIRKTGQVARSERMKREKTVAKRMMFLVVTDLVCWFPVIVVLFLSLADYFDDPNRSVFAWLAVCIIPINSAINPLLYTISTPMVLDKLKSLLPARCKTATQ